MSEALRAFLTELSDLTTKYGFVIEGDGTSDGYTGFAVVRGNGVRRDLVHDGERYDAY
ncbi:hypothetical protein [Streptomyces sp. NPDC002324]